MTIPKVYEEIFSPVDLEDRALLGTPLDEVYLVQNVVQRVKLVSAKAQVFVVNKDVSEVSKYGRGEIGIWAHPLRQPPTPPHAPHNACPSASFMRATH